MTDKLATGRVSVKAKATAKPARKTGRPTVKNETTRDRLIKAAAAGHSTLAAVARAAGISEDTLLNWRNEDPTLEPAIRSAIEARLDKIEAGVLAAAEEDPKLGLAVLKTRRDGYDTQKKVELTGKDGGPIVTAAVEKVAGLSDAELRDAIARLEAAIAAE